MACGLLSEHISDGKKVSTKPKCSEEHRWSNFHFPFNSGPPTFRGSFAVQILLVELNSEAASSMYHVSGKSTTETPVSHLQRVRLVLTLEFFSLRGNFLSRGNSN